MLGANDSKAGGAAARKNRWEVLDRLARNGAAVSPSQRNDFELWKRSWHEAMVEEHKGKWADTFSGWPPPPDDQKTSRRSDPVFYVKKNSVAPARRLFHGDLLCALKKIRKGAKQKTACANFE